MRTSAKLIVKLLGTTALALSLTACGHTETSSKRTALDGMSGEAALGDYGYRNRPVMKAEPVNGHNPSETIRQHDHILYFDMGSDELNNNSFDTLARWAAWLYANPSVDIQIDGYTDESGRENANIKLGHARADAVRDHLVELGIAPQRMTLNSWGEKRPAATVSTGRISQAYNRRAVITIVRDRARSGHPDWVANEANWKKMYDGARKDTRTTLPELATGNLH